MYICAYVYMYVRTYIRMYVNMYERVFTPSINYSYEHVNDFAVAHSSR